MNDINNDNDTDNINHNTLNQTISKVITNEGIIEGNIKRINSLFRRFDNFESMSKTETWVGKLIEKLPAETLIIVGIMFIVGAVLISTLLLYGLEFLASAIGTMDMFITLIIIWVRDKMNDKSTEELRRMNDVLINSIIQKRVIGENKTLGDNET